MTGAISAVQAATENSIKSIEQAFAARFNATDQGMTNISESLKLLTNEMRALAKASATRVAPADPTNEPPSKSRAVASTDGA
jgi:hypothetical protein